MSQPSTNEEYQSDSDTLRYEYEMLLVVFQRFGAGFPSEIDNALVESFAVHCRNLIDFLFIFERGRFPDDVLAVDFVNPATWKSKYPSMPDYFVKVRNQTGKQVAHITAQRRSLNQPGGTSSHWELQEIVESLTEVLIDFVKLCPPNRLSKITAERLPEYFDHFRRPPGRRVTYTTKVPDAAGSPTSCGTIWPYGKTSP